VRKVICLLGIAFYARKMASPRTSEWA
jgi:hypothetical protein